MAFTADPVTGKNDVVVESSPAGAEAIVSGRVEPERASFKRKELKGDAPEPLDPAGVPAAVARLALAAEELLDAPADIEWAFDGEQLWLLQARPITAGVSGTSSVPERDSGVDAGLLAESLRSRGSRRGGTSSEAARAPGEDYEAGSPASATSTPTRYRATAWSNVNTGEVLPHVVTPMTWSIVGHLATGLIDALFGKLGIRVDNDRLTTLIAGRAYFNASLLGSAFEKIPARGGQDITSIFGGEDAPPGFTDLPIAPEDSRARQHGPARARRAARAALLRAALSAR